MAGDGADGGTAQGPRSTQGVSPPEIVCMSSQDCGEGKYCAKVYEYFERTLDWVWVNRCKTKKKSGEAGCELEGEGTRMMISGRDTDGFGTDECVTGTEACGLPSAGTGEEAVCCPSGEVTRYGPIQTLFELHQRTAYCTEMADGTTCWSDSMCASKYCQGNLGGLQRGTCTSSTKANGETCTKDRECLSDACGRLSADDAHTNLYLCCDEITTYAGVDYCARLPVNAMCWSDAMCLTGLCKGNMGGLQRGLCSMG